MVSYPVFTVDATHSQSRGQLDQSMLHTMHWPHSALCGDGGGVAHAHPSHNSLALIVVCDHGSTLQ